MFAGSMLNFNPYVYKLQNRSLFNDEPSCFTSFSYDRSGNRRKVILQINAYFNRYYIKKSNVLLSSERIKECSIYRAQKLSSHKFIRLYISRK